MSENKKNWWEKVAIIATLTIALTGLVRLVWDSKPPKIDSSSQQQAQQNQFLQRQQIELLKRLDAMEKEQLKNNQDELESKLQALTAKLDESKTDSEVDTHQIDTVTNSSSNNQIITPNIPNIEGTWKNSDSNATYTLVQNAKRVTMREERVTQQGKITTAVGEGYIENNQINLSFTTIFETTGSGILNIADEKTLKGSLSNSSNNIKEDVVLKRN